MTRQVGRLQLRLRFPFFALNDEHGGGVGWVALGGPLRTPAEVATFELLQQHVRFLGLTSYLTFPAYREPGDERDYAGLCDAWCHCFRRPEELLPPDAPRLLLTHADFLDYVQASPYRQGGGCKDLDFVYVCQRGSSKELVKNWALAQRCLPVLTKQLALRGLLVGRGSIPDLPRDLPGLTVCDELPWPALMRAFGRARFLFVPNRLDPCPRIISEALAMDTPVVVNRRILGGWHYVTPFTGAFFEDERDLAAAVRRCRRQPLSPRRWFTSHHGSLLAGARLQRFLSALDPGLCAVRWVGFAEQLELPSARALG